MKTLLILRHAKSSWGNASLSDFERPLNKRGKYDAPRMGKLLRQEDLIPDLIVSSAANRALTTARLVADEVDCPQPVVATRDFYHASPDEYIAYLQGVPDENQSVMVVGHNPGMEELVTQLGGGYEVMPTAALAQFELDIASWQDFDAVTVGELMGIWRPKEINN